MHIIFRSASLNLSTFILEVLHFRNGTKIVGVTVKLLNYTRIKLLRTSTIISMTLIFPSVLFRCSLNAQVAEILNNFDPLVKTSPNTRHEFI